MTILLFFFVLASFHPKLFLYYLFVLCVELKDAMGLRKKTRGEKVKYNLLIIYAAIFDIRCIIAKMIENN